MRRVVLCTFSNIEAGAFGDAINDRKLYDAIPSMYNKIALFPKFLSNNKIKINSFLSFLTNYLREIIASDNIFIIRGSKLAILPILLRKIFRNKVILRLGCTPLMFVEKMAFCNELEYLPQNTFLKKIYNYFESHVEKFALRQADKILVENSRAEKIVNYYGAEKQKIKIIPYYIQNYFLEGVNPDLNRTKDCFKIGYTGRFKKYDLLEPTIEAIALLKKKSYKIKLYLIGDGPNREYIKKIVTKKGLNNEIFFLGSKSHIEVSKIISDYHCLLLPMLNKLCPSTIAIKVLEGVMKGKIIITTNSGNNPSLFREYKDMILEEPSSILIAEKIKLIIEEYDYYRRIAQNLKDYHLKFRSKSKYQNKLMEVLNEVM